MIADMVMATLIYRLHSGVESVTKEDHLASYYLDNQQNQADRLLCNGIDLVSQCLRLIYLLLFHLTTLCQHSPLTIFSQTMGSAIHVRSFREIFSTRHDPVRH